MPSTKIRKDSVCVDGIRLTRAMSSRLVRASEDSAGEFYAASRRSVPDVLLSRGIIAYRGSLVFALTPAGRVFVEQLKVLGVVAGE